MILQYLLCFQQYSYVMREMPDNRQIVVIYMHLYVAALLWYNNCIIL